MTTQQTDRELLELAAKAAGFHDKLLFSDIHDTAYWNDRYSGDWGEHDAAADWNPLNYDGDALRLAVKLRLCIEHNHAADQQRWVAADRAGCELCYAPVGCVEDDFEDELQRGAATRRAIVRAAAEIGKAMP